MSDLEFLSLFEITELPDCSTGLWLLKQWIESEPAVLWQLGLPERLNVEELRRGGNPVYLKFVGHTQKCAECNRLLPGLHDQLVGLSATSNSPDRN